MCIYDFGDHFFVIFLIIPRIRVKKPTSNFKFVGFFEGNYFFIVMEWHELVVSKLQKFQVNYGSAQSRGKPGISALSKAVVACDVSGMGAIFSP